MQNTSPPFWRNYADPVDVTSWTYPVEVVESLDVGLAFGANSRFIQAPMDEMDISLALTGGSLVNTLLSYSHPAEDNLDVALAIVSGTLVNTLLSHTQPHEDSLDVAFAITNGTLENGLVSNTMDPESMDVSLAITAGTLV